MILLEIGKNTFDSIFVLEKSLPNIGRNNSCSDLSCILCLMYCSINKTRKGGSKLAEGLRFFVFVVVVILVKMAL